MFNMKCYWNHQMAVSSQVSLSRDWPSHFHTFAHAVPSRLLAVPSPKLHLLRFSFFKVQLKVVQPRPVWVLTAL